MSIVSVDNIQPIGSGTTVTVNKSVTLESGNTNITGVCTATSFSGSGANLTNLPAQATISNNANDRVITGGSGVNLNGESGLTFNGNNLAINASSDDGRVSIVGHEGYDARLSLVADQGDDHIDQWNIRSKASNNTLTIDQFGGGTFNTRLTIASDANNGNVTVNTGNLIIGTSGKGIDFSAAGNVGGMTSELLDDYEEGSFSPTLVNGSNGYRFQQGTYTKIGNVVTFTAYIETSATPPSGNLAFGNLPFTSIGSRSWVFPFHTNRTSFGTNSFDARAYMGGTDTNIYIYYPVNSSSSNFQPINQNGMNAANASSVWISGSYHTAS